MHVSQNIVVTAKTFLGSLTPADPESVSPAGSMIPAVLLDDLSSFVITAFSHQFRQVVEGRFKYSPSADLLWNGAFVNNKLFFLVIF